MDSFYLTLSSDSSKQFFPDNAAAHFTTQLARPVCLTPFYEVAVCEVFLPPLEGYWKLREVTTPIYLYCDLIQPVFLCDTLCRLLRVLPSDSLSGHHLFPVNHYIPVDRHAFQTVTLSFHARSGQRYSFGDSTYPTTVVLHFRERPAASQWKSSYTPIITESKQGEARV